MDMMNRSLLVLAVAMVSIAAVLPAWTEDTKKEERKVEMSSEERSVQSEKDILVGNINALRNQETRVTILQQLLNEGIDKLRQMEAVFCDHYNLDLEKYRAGKYLYDADTGKFIEKKE